MSVTNNKYLSQAAIVCCILRAFTANNRCPNRLQTTGICGKQRVSVATAIISCNEGCLEVVLWTYLASWTQDRITAHWTRKLHVCGGITTDVLRTLCVSSARWQNSDSPHYCKASTTARNKKKTLTKPRGSSRWCWFRLPEQVTGTPALQSAEEQTNAQKHGRSKKCQPRWQSWKTNEQRLGPIVNLQTQYLSSTFKRSTRHFEAESVVPVETARLNFHPRGNDSGSCAAQRNVHVGSTFGTEYR